MQPKFTSHSDPASQWTAARKGRAFFSYSDNYLIDTDHGVIVDVEATRSIRQAEVRLTKTMLKRVDTTIVNATPSTKNQAKDARTARRLQTMPGIGPFTALAVETFAPPMQVVKCGRSFVYWRGQVPRQHSSGLKA